MKAVGARSDLDGSGLVDVSKANRAAASDDDRDKVFGRGRFDRFSHARTF
jgi:hypothetical protein